MKSSSSKKIYKAIISDIDGTLLSKKTGKLPSEKVTQAILKMQGVHFSLATARPWFMVEHIVNHLHLTGPSIINGGAQIIDVKTQETLWEKTVPTKNLQKIFSILREIDIPFFINDDGEDIDPDASYIPSKPYSITTEQITNEKADEIVTNVSHIPFISAHKFVWQKDKTMGVSINHAEATKQHAVFEICKILNLNKEEIVGIGDSYNDFPLLMACGLKVAVGNAPDDLKVIADYVAPSVDDDGVADVIEKFVL